MSHRLQNTITVSIEPIEGDTLNIEDLARLCCVTTDWVEARLLDELLVAERRDGIDYFSSATRWRARQMAWVEQQFDADPILAALVADLTEEVRQLRERLAACEGR
jgi:chaperone modulatory protein CbpM